MSAGSWTAILAAMMILPCGSKPPTRCLFWTSIFGSALGVRVVALQQSALQAASARAATKSERVLALTGVPSVAETAALAAAGADARLIATRLVVGGAACALAASGDAP